MNREHVWEIAVSAGGYYPDLAENFSGWDIGLGYENDHLGMQFFAYSYHIDELTDPKDVARRLYSLELLLNGSLRIEQANIGLMPISFTNFCKIGAGGMNSVWADSIEDYPFSRNPLVDTFSHPYDDPTKGLDSCLLHLARKDDELRTLLFLVGLISTHTTVEKILTWSTLYKILDCVQHYSKQMSYEIKNFVDTKELKKFTAACNNMSILGINARHGASGNTPPSAVMTDLNEAINLILSMTRNFIFEFLKDRHSVKFVLKKPQKSADYDFDF